VSSPGVEPAAVPDVLAPPSHATHLHMSRLPELRPAHRAFLSRLSEDELEEPFRGKIAAFTDGRYQMSLISLIYN
jgi:hypothetical protein